MKVQLLFLATLLYSDSYVLGQTHLVLNESNSTSEASIALTAEPDSGGTGTYMENSNSGGSVAGGGVSDSSDLASGSISASTSGTALPGQIVLGASWIGQLLSHNGPVCLNNFDPPPAVGDVVLSGEDEDGDGIDDAVDAEIIVFDLNGNLVTFHVGMDDDGNGREDWYDDLLTQLAPGRAGEDVAYIQSSTLGTYEFLKNPAPEGWVWVAKGTYGVEIGGPDTATASVENPAVTAAVQDGMATSVAVDVLNGVTTVTIVDGGEGIGGTWSTIVGVGAGNFFPMTGNVRVESAACADNGQSVDIGGLATGNIAITAVILVSIDSLPPMVDVFVGDEADGDAEGDVDEGDGEEGDIEEGSSFPIPVFNSYCNRLKSEHRGQLSTSRFLAANSSIGRLREQTVDSVQSSFASGLPSLNQQLGGGTTSIACESLCHRRKRAHANARKRIDIHASSRSAVLVRV